MMGLVGYCPQNNPIHERMTVKRVLWYFCELVGIRKDTITQTIEDTIQRFDLKDHENKKCGTLSGGNKRKLVCAQACIGNPKVLIVDEVSAGIDPVARRKIWKAMRHEAQNSAMILTTHTMEEAEALSTKIGIMVNGRFKCFGSLQSIQ
jgi:ABC-type multidrug transport system ATPase subunit